MESSLSLSAITTTSTLFTISKALNRHLCRKPALSYSFLPGQFLTRRIRCISNGSAILSSSSSSPPRRGLEAVLPLIRRRLECLSSSAASFASGGGGFGGESGGGGGGGGGDGMEGGDVKSRLVPGGAEELSVLSPDVIILDVGGMTCGGCAASVKRILENQPQVSSASVNLTTETAIVWPVSEAKVTPNWQKQLGEALAEQLTSCGFKSSLRGQEANEGDISP